ncbi:hypothetical protein HDA32_005540 [Spinactinospora alkalitolerans]|uniref:Uncharacterized protein n=1 Tax=Spinactinospora alkalitolerans TaxID=687207 RepID=A0A852U905_9ACTN|nr:hypothetical protein [Spinactinospora alkalitolerans]NYE50420.1 hypothetical protein [Spinactinospora alkalitolerans]
MSDTTHPGRPLADGSGTTTATAGRAPVFVDATGRRRRLALRLAYGAAGCCVVIVVGIGVLLGSGTVPHGLLSLPFAPQNAVDRLISGLPPGLLDTEPSSGSPSSADSPGSPGSSGAPAPSPDDRAGAAPDPARVPEAATGSGDGADPAAPAEQAGAEPGAPAGEAPPPAADGGEAPAPPAGGGGDSGGADPAPGDRTDAEPPAPGTSEPPATQEPSPQEPAPSPSPGPVDASPGTAG